MTKPGVQKPHCEPWYRPSPAAPDAAGPGDRSADADRHDMASIERADETDAGIDAFIDQLPSEAPTSTVQAPQSPSAQPSLVPRSAVEPQEIEQGLHRRHGRKLDRRCH
jgi:hypothetical protein